MEIGSVESSQDLLELPKWWCAPLLAAPESPKSWTSVSGPHEFHKAPAAVVSPCDEAGEQRRDRTGMERPPRPGTLPGFPTSRVSPAPAQEAGGTAAPPRGRTGRGNSSWPLFSILSQAPSSPQSPVSSPCFTAARFGTDSKPLWEQWVGDWRKRHFSPLPK